MILPPWVSTYRKALVLAGTAVAAGATAWTVQGWRKDKAMAEVQLDHSQAEVRRSYAATSQWIKATDDLAEATKAAQAKLEAARRANAALVKASVQATPKGPEWACRDKALPEDYLETFRK
jgi:hypothetical protein